MILAPHPSASWRVRMASPMRQYSPSSSVFTALRATARVVRTASLSSASSSG